MGKIIFLFARIFMKLTVVVSVIPEGKIAEISKAVVVRRRTPLGRTLTRIYGEAHNGEDSDGQHRS